MVGQKQQDWRVRPNEDACDSLDLGDEGAVEGLDHHSSFPHTDPPYHIPVVVRHNSDRGASGPEVAHAPHRSSVDPEVGRLVAHRNV